MPAAPPKIDRYEVLGQLGKGANGIVYLARDTRVGRDVAIKVINPELAVDPVVLQRFHREAKAIARLHHGNVLQLIDYSGPNAKLPYLVTERLHGTNLDDLIGERGTPLDGATAAAMVHEICLGLQHAHSLGIVHRDLKPENVFLEPEGRVVLCDFGIARSFDSAEVGTLASKNTRLAGSPLYMSPEQVSNPASVGPTSDMFSLGSLLFFLVTGRHAFMADTVVSALKRIVNATPDDLRALAPNLPERLYRIVDKLLSKDPARRYTSAQAIADSLLLIVKESGHADPRRALSSMLQTLGRSSATRVKIIPVEELDEESKTMVMSATGIKAITKAAPSAKPSAVITQSTTGERTREVKIHPVTRPAGKSETPPAATHQPNVSLIVIAILGVALIAAAALLLTATKPPPPLPKVPSAISSTGTLRISTQAGADVFIDERRIGSSGTLGPTPLPAGLHTLRVIHPKLGKYEEQFEIHEGEDTTLNVDLKKSKR